MKVEENRPLSTLSTFAIGGPARYLIEVHDLDEMKEALRFAERENLPTFFLGKGSNCLFDDAGYEGVVVLNKINTFKEVGSGRYYVGAGFSFPRLGVRLSREGWSGLEFAAGIPGSVGGAIFMNAGANGQETKDCLESVHYLDENGEEATIERPKFSYRWSQFHQMNGAILGATFQLTPSESAKTTQREIVEYRTATQPYDKPSAGCIFRNPEVAAGRLIEESGMKGERVGDAEVSTVHANFIVNHGTATAKQVLDLAKEVEERVYNKTGVRLERELRFIPCKEERP